MRSPAPPTWSVGIGAVVDTDCKQRYPQPVVAVVQSDPEKPMHLS